MAFFKRMCYNKEKTRKDFTASRKEIREALKRWGVASTDILFCPPSFKRLDADLRGRCPY